MLQAIIAQNYPKSVMDYYIQQRFVESDIIPAYAARHLRPFTWTEARNKSVRPKPDFEIEAITRELGVRDGFAVAMRDIIGINLTVSLGSDEVVILPPHLIRLLHMVCLHAGMRAIELKGNQKRTIRKLTAREQEVLKWLARGKTISETADIMSISFATAKTHCEHARLKLGSSNTTHAVVQAIRSKDIIL